MWRSAVPEVVSSRVIYYHAIHVISSMEFRRGGGSGPIRAVSHAERGKFQGDVCGRNVVMMTALRYDPADAPFG